MRQGLPVKLSDGSLKQVRLEGRPLREDDAARPTPPPDAKPLGDRARKRLRKQRAQADAAAAEELPAEVREGGDYEAEEVVAAPRGAAPVAAAAASPEEKKETMARLCTRLLRDPEGGIGGLTQLHSLCLDADPVT